MLGRHAKLRRHELWGGQPELPERIRLPLPCCRPVRFQREIVEHHQAADGNQIDDRIWIEDFRLA